MDISVVVPCYNEALVIEQTLNRLVQALDPLDIDYELLFVDDGSRDETATILTKLSASNARCRLVRLSRNFGHQNAVTAGIDRSAGDAVVLIDADLQDPPELIGEMVRLWRSGVQVVYGLRVARTGESAFKRASAAMFYRTMNAICDTRIPVDTGDFRLMDRKVVNALMTMPERDRFLRGMVSWVGFRQVALPYAREPRFAGESKYPFWKMIRFALDAVTSFSIAPLRLATWIGFIVSTLALIGVVATFLIRVFTQSWVPGWAGLLISVLFLGGVQLICVGIVGEYVGRIYGEVKRRPLYLVDD